MTDLYETPPLAITAGDREANVATKPAKRESVTPRWETETRERVRAGIRRYAKPLSDLCTRDANEGDTRLLVNRILTDVLGYDEFSELTTEYAVKGEFADYGIRIDRDLVAFVEVKRISTKLATKHLRQVEMYAVNEGVEWVILTNGAEWRAYHLGSNLPVEIDLALEVNLVSDETTAHKASQLFDLTRESLKRRQIDEIWRAKRATSPKSLAAVLGSPAVTEAIRKELRRATGQKIAANDVSRLLQETVLRPECLK